MKLHRSWGVQHTLALGLALCSRSSEGFGPVDPTVVYRSRGQHHHRTRATTPELRSSTSPLPPPGDWELHLRSLSCRRLTAVEDVHWSLSRDGIGGGGGVEHQRCGLAVELPL